MAEGLTAATASASPVVSLAITREGPVPQILVVVRARDTNLTHGDVVSVPTIRVPRGVLERLLAATVPVGRHGSTNLLEGPSIDNWAGSSHDEVAFVVRSVLSQKLGVADAIERRALKFRAKVVTHALGCSWYAEGEGASSERIEMLGIGVRVVQGADRFPEITASHTLQRWLAMDEFLTMVQTKDTSALGQAEATLCVHGLCISNTYDRMAADAGAPSFAELVANAVAALPPADGQGANAESSPAK